VALNIIKQTNKQQTNLFQIICISEMEQIWAISWGWSEPENPEKTTDLSQVTEKLYHIMLYTTATAATYEISQRTKCVI
jgi:hypothetical protein